MNNCNTECTDIYNKYYSSIQQKNSSIICLLTLMTAELSKLYQKLFNTENITIYAPNRIKPKIIRHETMLKKAA